MIYREESECNNYEPGWLDLGSQDKELVWGLHFAMITAFSYSTIACVI
jgi:hypothetical protein